MDSRTNAIVEAAAEIVRDTDVERYKGYDGDDGPSTLRAAAARIRADLPAAIAALDAAATTPAPLPDDVRRDVDAARAFLVEMRDWSGREIAREALAALDRIAARLTTNGGSNV